MTINSLQTPNLKEAINEEETKRTLKSVPGVDKFVNLTPSPSTAPAVTVVDMRAPNKRTPEDPKSKGLQPNNQLRKEQNDTAESANMASLDRSATVDESKRTKHSKKRKKRRT